MRVLDKFSMEIRNETIVPTCHVITPPACFSETLLSDKYHELNNITYSIFGLLLATSMPP